MISKGILNAKIESNTLYYSRELWLLAIDIVTCNEAEEYM